MAFSTVDIHWLRSRVNECLHNALVFRSLLFSDVAIFLKSIVPFLMWSLIKANRSSMDRVAVLFAHSFVHLAIDPAESEYVGTAACGMLNPSAIIFMWAIRFDDFASAAVSESFGLPCLCMVSTVEKLSTMPDANIAT